ncbi:MAG: TetR/AcrR family transcriptional regulator [Negativicutes bacterium]|nr:TetR/AcrR family transcriptional regulator [Negativicutes bacterium]
MNSNSTANHLTFYEAKDRILQATQTLFAEKGFDATSISEISKKASVNKALIYYYFANKEAILDIMLEQLFEESKSLSMNFIQDHILSMISNNLLDILPDRFHFVNEEAAKYFLQQMLQFYGRTIDFILERKQLVKILFLESLKSGKHHNDLFRFTELIKGNESNPLYQEIKAVDAEFAFPVEITVFNFFFFLQPLISYAVYADDFYNVFGIPEEGIRDHFMRSIQTLLPSFIAGPDILLSFTAKLV